MTFLQANRHGDVHEIPWPGVATDTLPLKLKLVVVSCVGVPIAPLLCIVLPYEPVVHDW